MLNLEQHQNDQPKCIYMLDDYNFQVFTSNLDNFN
jgi:hypothetical protein